MKLTDKMHATKTKGDEHDLILRRLGELHAVGDLEEKDLDELEELLSKVDEKPDNLMKEALGQTMKALLNGDLLEHSSTDVKASLASCLCVLTRITGPEPPYTAKEMKRIFKCIVSSFEDLSGCGPSYAKRVSILESVYKGRLYITMLHLGLDDLIVELFKHLLNSQVSDYNLMEDFMVLGIQEIKSEGLKLALRDTLLEARHEQLAGSIITKCSLELMACVHGNAIDREAKKLEGTVSSNFSYDSAVEKPPETAAAIQKPLEENEVQLQSGSQQEESQNKIQIEKGIRSKRKGPSLTTKVNEGASDGDQGLVAKKCKLSVNETNSDAKSLKTTSGGVSQPDEADVSNKDVGTESDDMLLKPFGKKGQKRNLASRPSEDDVANKDEETLNFSDNKDDVDDETYSDRPSEFPDCVINRILNFVGTKQAVGTSALVSGWRHKWTKTTCLSFSCEEFRTSYEFSEFVKHVLSRRDDTIDVFSVKLTVCAKVVSKEIMKQILNYAISRNLQQLSITSLNNEESFELCPSLLSSKSLTHLTLDGYDHRENSFTWDLPALETLNLYHFKIDSDKAVVFLLRSCAKLKNLAMKNCRLMCRLGFNICHDGLSSLTLEEGRESRGTPVSVEAPRLEYLTIRNWPDIRLFFTPNLSSLCYIDYGNGTENDPCEEGPDHDYYELGIHPLQTSGKNYYHLEKLLICIDRPIKEKEICMLISMLEDLLPTVRSLTLNSELAKLLTPFVKSPHRFTFSNLEAVKVYPLNVFTPVGDSDKVEFKQVQVEVHHDFENFIKVASRNHAKLSIVAHEETISMDNLTLAWNLILQFQVVLKEWEKELIVETELKLTTNSKHFLQVVDKRSRISATFCSRTASLLQMIYIALTRVPPSHQAATELQARYSILYAEGISLQDRILDVMQTQTKRIMDFPSTTLLSYMRW